MGTLRLFETYDIQETMRYLLAFPMLSAAAMAQSAVTVTTFDDLQSEIWSCQEPKTVYIAADITVTTPLVIVSEAGCELTVSGASAAADGAPITLDGDEISRIMTIYVGKAPLRFENLILKGGLAEKQMPGGAVNIFGAEVTFDNVDFRDDVNKKSAVNKHAQGGAVYSLRGDVTFNDCNFANNTARIGGGVYVERADATFNNCNFARNDAVTGAAVTLKHRGSHSFNDCTFSENDAKLFAGAVDMRKSDAHFKNCVFSDGEAKKGSVVHVFRGTAEFENCQLSGNRGEGAIHLLKAETRIQSTTFENNDPIDLYFSGSKSDVYEDCSRTLTYGGRTENAIFHRAQPNPSGPVDWTTAAITDAACPAKEVVVETFDDFKNEVDNCIGITQFNLASGIKLTEPLVLPEGKGCELTITGAPAVDGEPKVEIDGGDDGQVLTVNKGNGIVFSNLKFKNGNSQGDNGGAVEVNGGAVKFQGCDFEDSEAIRDGGKGGNGGALHVKQGSVEFDDCHFTGNKGTYGGAVRLEGGDSTFRNSNFTVNESDEDGIYGGAAYISGGIHHCEDCNFEDNMSRQSGAVEIENAQASFTRCSFARNIALYDVGAVTVFESHVEFTDCEFVNNYGGGRGALFVTGESTVYLEGTKFEGNLNNRRKGKDLWVQGGAVYYDCSNLTPLRYKGWRNGQLFDNGQIYVASCPTGPIDWANGNKVFVRDHADDIQAACNSIVSPSCA